MSDAQGGAPEGPAAPDRRRRPAVHGVPPSGSALHGHWLQWPHRPHWQLPHHRNPYGTPTPGLPGYDASLQDPDARPVSVLAAVIVTLISTGLMLVLVGGAAFWLLAGRTDTLSWGGDRVNASAAQVDASVPLVVLVLLVLLFWCLATIVLAVLALCRSNAARIALVVSSALTALVSLLAIGAVLPVVFLAAAIAVIVLLFTGGAGDWFRREHLYSPPQLPRL